MCPSPCHAVGNGLDHSAFSVRVKCYSERSRPFPTRYGALPRRWADSLGMTESGFVIPSAKRVGIRILFLDNHSFVCYTST